MNFLRLAKVAETHPEDNSVDIVMVDDGSRWPGVICATPFAAKNSGISNMPVVTPAGRDKWDLTQAGDDAQLAIVGFLGESVPIVLGFLFPQINQMLFADKNRRIDRHVSDVYTTTDKDGNFELYHPSGTFLRVATSAAHEDLAGHDFDGKWAISKNTDKAVYVRLRVANAGAQKALITIDPSGNVNVDHTGNLTWHTAGTATVNIDGNATATFGGNVTASVAGNLSASVTGNAGVTVGGTTDLTSTGAATVIAPTVRIQAATTTVTGALIVQGLLTFQAGMAGSGGGGGGTANITGNVNITGSFSTTGTFQNNGKSVGSTHTHGGVQTGSGSTAVPN